MKRLKMIILNYMVKNLFVGLTEEDVFKVLGGKLFIGEDEVTEETARMYKQKAQDIMNSEVWKAVMKKIWYEAEKTTFQNAQTNEDCFFGKAMILNIDLIQKYLEKLSRIKL